MSDQVKGIHPLCEVVLPMSKAEYELLRDGMKESGFHPNNPVILYKGYVLDGRHRLKAAEELNLKPIFAEYEGNEDSIPQYIADMAIRQRNLSAGQRAAIASEVANILPNNEGSGNQVKSYSVSKACAQWNTTNNYISQYRKLKEEAPDLAMKVKLNSGGKDKTFSLNAGVTELKKRVSIEFQREQKQLKNYFNDYKAKKNLDEATLDDMRECFSIASLRDVGYGVCLSNMKDMFDDAVEVEQKAKPEPKPKVEPEVEEKDTSTRRDWIDDDDDLTWAEEIAEKERKSEEEMVELLAALSKSNMELPAVIETREEAYLAIAKVMNKADNADLNRIIIKTLKQKLHPDSKLGIDPELFTYLPTIEEALL